MVTPLRGSCSQDSEKTIGNSSDLIGRAILFIFKT
jgi:hypothetical protein